MVVLNRIYTRTGDDGTTALGTGERRKKYDLRVAAYGTLDEANAALGIARLHTANDRALFRALSRSHCNRRQCVPLSRVHRKTARTIESMPSAAGAFADPFWWRPAFGCGGPRRAPWPSLLLWPSLSLWAPQRPPSLWLPPCGWRQAVGEMC
jgi:hypothetical protein